MKKSLLIVLVLGFLCIISIPQESIKADSHLPFPNLVNELFRSGGNGSKMNIVIIGDGFLANTAPGVGDQATFDNFVDTNVMEIFNNDLFEETKNAFNVYSINLVSNEQGVTQVTPNTIPNNNATGGAFTDDLDGDGIFEARDTALGYEYSGDWNRCWLEFGPNTLATETNVLNTLVPQWDYAIVILNETGFGACALGNTFRMTMNAGSTWQVAGHELGHSIGGLGDEYIASAGNYLGVEPGAPNLTINNNRNTIKWGDGGLGFVDPNTAIPTPFTLNAFLNAGPCGGLDPVEDAGVFAGGTIGAGSWTNGIFRAHCNDRMNTNNPPYGAVNYNLMRTAIDPFHDYDFDNSYVGDFNGDNKDDLVLHNGNSLGLYVSTGSELELDWIATPKIANWEFKSGDKFYVGDFSGDGLDDLFVVNHTGWKNGSTDKPHTLLGMLRSTGSGFVLENRFDDTLPGWDSMKSNDEFFVADFNGDGLDDLFVFNGAIGVDWDIAYLQMLKSTGKGLYSGHNHRSGLEHVKRYDDTLPGWDSMKSHDEFFVADIGGDGLEELYVFNGAIGIDWKMGYLQLLKSTATSLQYVKRYDDIITPHYSFNTFHWKFTSNDQFYVADFDGDGDDDLYLFNGHDWDHEYLYMLRSDGTFLKRANIYEDIIQTIGWKTTWTMSRNDQWFVADIDGNGMEDLYVYNNADPDIPSHNGMHMDMEYLGILRSTGGDLEAQWQGDLVGNWDMGLNDKFLVANFNGVYGLNPGWDDLFVFDTDWFGMLRSHQDSVQLNSIYPDWIHNHNYHNLGWW